MDPTLGVVSHPPQELALQHFSAGEEELVLLPSSGRLFVNEELYEELVSAKKRSLALPEYDKKRDEANPFHFLGKSLFLNRAAVKLANLDYVFNLSNHTAGQGEYQTTIAESSYFSFCDLAGGPGGFTQYLLWRRPLSTGYGITLKTKDRLDWDPQVTQNSRFTITYGKDGTGNLYQNDEWFVDWLLSQKPQGVELVVADGGFDVETETDFRKREILTSRLVLVQLFVGVQICRVGKHLVCKVFDTNTELSASYIYLLSRCFERIYLMKPLSSRPASNEKYLICTGRKEDISEPLSYLATLRDMFLQTDFPDFAVALPDNFIEWLSFHNNLFTTKTKEAAESILKKEKTVGENNYFDCFFLWQLPA